MTGTAPRIGERLAGDGDELPRVGPGIQRQFQHSRGRPVAHLAVRERYEVGVETRAAGPHNEFPNPRGRIGLPRGSLRRKSLVVVLVSRNHDLRAGIVQRLPHRLHRRVAAMLGPRAEPRVVPVRDCALLRTGGEIRAEPRHLGRIGGPVDVAVQ